MSTQGFTTAFDIDLTAQSTQSFTTDGTYTIAGYTWTKGNSANESTHASLINGTGVNFQPTSTSDYNGGTRTFPYLWLPFTQIFPTALDWETQLRLYISIGTDNSAANYDNEVMGLDTNSTALGYIIKRGYGTSGQGSQALLNFNSGNTNNFVNDSYTVASNATTSKTICIHFHNLLLQKVQVFRSNSISAGTSFPAIGTMQPAQITMVGGNGTGSFGTDYTNITLTSSSLGVILGAQRAGSGTSLSVNYQRVRLDYKI